MAALLDRTALRKEQPSALVVACGHFREGLLSTAVQSGAFGEVVAFDQDGEALTTVSQVFRKGVKTEPGSIRQIVAGRHADRRFDLIYTAGLYDYLARPVATRLTAQLFGMLAPGGELVVANFTHDVADAGYMESFMAWTLIFRSLDELYDLADELPPTARSSASVYRLEAPDIAYMKIMKG